MTSDWQAPRRTAAVLHPVGPDTTAMELMVMSWFAAGHELMWIPIIEVGSDRDGAARAQDAAAAIGGPRLLTGIDGLRRLPSGIKGWLLPAHLDDTCVVVVRDAAGEVTFASVVNPVTGQTISWRTCTEDGVAQLGRADRAQPATEATAKRSV
jgi:hypothetical protein